ncbi:MAG: ATP-dependent helicase RecG, partial [Candidatus Eremiobacteraeota bacterium]|nr:ATP-dependent helicase RecG [Candidatus Eremiobacteraeota bacterium]
MPINTLQEGEAIVVGRVLRVKERKGRNRFQVVTAALQDDTGVIEAKWFGQRYIAGKLSAGDRVFVAGRVTRAGLLPEINVGAHKLLRENERYEGEIIPVYAATKDLPT